jgi:hypothetical protein
VEPQVRFRRERTWVTPLFHWTSDQDGGFVSTHVGPYLQGKNYWMLFPLAGSRTHDDESTSTWITPLFHLTRDKEGKVEDYHVGPTSRARTGGRSRRC